MYGLISLDWLVTRESPRLGEKEKMCEKVFAFPTLLFLSACCITTPNVHPKPTLDRIGTLEGGTPKRR